MTHISALDSDVCFSATKSLPSLSLASLLPWLFSLHVCVHFQCCPWHRHHRPHYHNYTLTSWQVSVFRDFLVRIFPHSDWIRRDTEYLPYSVRLRENMEQKNSKYGHFSPSVSNKLPIWISLCFRYIFRYLFSHDRIYSDQNSQIFYQCRLLSFN